MDADAPAGAKKRGAPETGEARSLEAIREVIKGELSASSVSLRQELSQSVNHRMDAVEEKVGKQLEKTIDKLAQLTDHQSQQGQAITEVRAEQKEVSGRLQQLEQKVQHMQLHGGSSTADTEGGAKQPVLILGGWDDESPAAETLQKAKEMIQQLRIDIDMELLPGRAQGVRHCAIPGTTGRDGGAAEGAPPTSPPPRAHRQHCHGEKGRWSDQIPLDAAVAIARETAKGPAGRQSEAPHPLPRGKPARSNGPRGPSGTTPRESAPRRQA